MKKKLKLLLFMLILLPSVALANESYVNYYGIEMSEEEYSNLLGLGFTEDEIHHMEEDEFNTNKDINSSLDAVEVKYYMSTVRYDSTGRVVHTSDMQVSENDYNASDVSTYSSAGLIETTYKELRTTIAQAGTKYRYKVTLTWKQLPKVRSYDIIGIGIEPYYVYISGNVVFNQTYCISNSCTNTNTYNMDNYSLNGAGVSFKLASNSGITALRSYFYFDVNKNYSGTITLMYADGDYSHATSTVTASQALGYTVNQAGINLDDGIFYYYDSIDAATATWTGSW